MDRNFLLTYSNHGHAEFEWFETEEEMRDAIRRWEIEEEDIFEMTEVLGRREITL